ncbi:hypothetical protein GOP47_0007679 [Adiantum capillus-veneris]|uniref:Uncharacterized protein n=1 Tax=Adiantum capillus-veneris TaxID=13818 RepID=A0A9D4V1R3_ADICA|nr:hypothetical protein GOP47_0007679 [Adiantum capillus-veneris]
MNRILETGAFANDHDTQSRHRTKARGLRWGSKETGPVTFKLSQLCFTIHLNNKGNHENEEGSTGNPSSFARAPHKLLAKAGSNQGLGPRVHAKKLGLPIGELAGGIVPSEVVARTVDPRMSQARWQGRDGHLSTDHVWWDIIDKAVAASRKPIACKNCIFSRAWRGRRGRNTLQS